jgi:hypothetical protein
MVLRYADALSSEKGVCERAVQSATRVNSIARDSALRGSVRALIVGPSERCGSMLRDGGMREIDRR